MAPSVDARENHLPDGATFQVLEQIEAVRVACWMKGSHKGTQRKRNEIGMTFARHSDRFNFLSSVRLGWWSESSNAALVERTPVTLPRGADNQCNDNG